MNESNELKPPKKTNTAQKFGRLTGYFIAYTFFIAVLIGIVSTIIWGYNATFPYYGHTNKKVLHERIEKAVINSASLPVIRVIFKNRASTMSLWYRWFSNDPDYYEEPISLDKVLKDMMAKSYLSDNPNSDLQLKLSVLILENSTTNPFDKLHAYQRDFFENIRIKLGDKYDLVKNDVNKISEELISKNDLVKEYLSDATTSLVISITGLIFALIIGIYQILLGRRKKKEVEKRDYQIIGYISSRIHALAEKIDGAFSGGP